MTGFDNGKPYFNPIDDNLEDESIGNTQVPMDIFSSKDCDNTESQRFYLVNEIDKKDIDSYPEMDSTNKHLHLLNN